MFLSKRTLKRQRKKIFKFVESKLNQLLSGYYQHKKLHPNASKDEIYLNALLSVDGMIQTEASKILEYALETAEKHNQPLDLRGLAKCLIVFGMPAEYDAIVEKNTANPFSNNAKFEETFTSYYQIVESIIPPNL